MNELLKPGLTYTLEKIVTADDTASKYGSGLIEVYATPAMIALMEKTSMELVLPFLSEGQNTVGTEVNIKHIKATPVGGKIHCTARLTEVDGRRLVFEVGASDAEGKIGSGTHTRYVIDTEKFMSKLQ
jgi:fluoroacetyl-CoA thioesterase